MSKSSKKLERQIDEAYQKYMTGVQVNIMDLGNVSRTVLAEVLTGKSIEEGYAVARERYAVN